MANEKKFIGESIRRLQVEDILSKRFSRAGYSHTEIHRTPLSMRITIYAQKPGLIIGRGGRNIESVTKMIKEEFGFENPQLDVQEVTEPNLDPHIITRQIMSALERGLHYKRVANITIQKVMNSGAAGVAVRISGKMGGAMGRTEKFSAGYLKYSGDPAETLVKKSNGTAHVKLGTIGVQVRILKEKPYELEAFEKLTAPEIEEPKEEKPTEEKLEEPTEEKTEETKEESKEEVKENADNEKETDKTNDKGNSEEGSEKA